MKYYLVEPGTPTVQNLFAKAHEISISNISKSEMISGLNFKRRYANLSESDYQRVVTEFDANYADFKIIALDERVEAKVKICAEKHAHKALDNIQLASALVARPKYFVTADKKLAKLARSEKLNVKLV